MNPHTLSPIDTMSLTTEQIFHGLEWGVNMAKTSYFVIVYRILSYLQTCFETGAEPDLDAFGAGALRISEAYWANVLESMMDEGYIKGVKFFQANGLLVPNVDYIKITQKGMEHLEENSMMAKARKALKEIKETVPGL